MIRSRFNGPKNREYSFVTEGASRTQQQFKDECDINNIMARYKKTGVLPVKNSNGVFGDFSTVDDYLSSMKKIMDAEESFSALPSHIRSKFLNDPAKIIEFLSDDNNRDEAEKLGLVPKKITTPSLKDQMVEALAENDVKRSKTKKD